MLSVTVDKIVVGIRVVIHDVYVVPGNVMVVGMKDVMYEVSVDT
jgi:hypothetical protein